MTFVVQAVPLIWNGQFPWTLTGLCAFSILIGQILAGNYHFSDLEHGSRKDG